jgi:hypothetical protein
MPLSALRSSAAGADPAASNRRAVPGFAAAGSIEVIRVFEICFADGRNDRGRASLRPSELNRPAIVF